MVSRQSLIKLLLGILLAAYLCYAYNRAFFCFEFKWALFHVVLLIICASTLLSFCLDITVKRSAMYEGIRIALYSTAFMLIIAEIVLKSMMIETLCSELNGNGYSSPFRYSSEGKYQTRSPNAVSVTKTHEFSFVKATNELGLSGKLPPKQKSKTEKRVLLLGDSFTEGVGCSDDSTTAIQLSRLAGSDGKHNYTITVINGGVATHDPVFSYKMLHDKLLVYKPDLVIINISLGDLFDMKIRGAEERYDENSDLRPIHCHLLEPLFYASRIFRMVNNKLLKQSSLFVPMDMSAVNFDTTINQLNSLFVKYIQLGEQYEFQFAIVYFPILPEMRKQNYFKSLSFQNPSIPIVSILPYFDNVL